MKIYNKRASFDYSLEPTKIEAGIVLKGIEAKAFREKRASLNQAYVKIIDNEIYLINANMPGDNQKGYNPTRSRKLLLHKNQILSLQNQTKQKKLQIVPTMMYNSGRKIKLSISLGKSKKKFEKKNSIKKKDIERDVLRELNS